MKQIEEYVGTLITRGYGKMTHSDADKVINITKPIYGCSIGNFIELLDTDKEYPEDELNQVGYYRIVKVEKVVTTINSETIWHI